MSGGQRQGKRVIFEKPVPAQLMAIDGTWRRGCSIDDVSDGGAKLTVGSSIEGLQLAEFFLVLSSTGLAYRRCQLSWVNGDQIGVIFLRHRATRKPGRPEPDKRAS